MSIFLNQIKKGESVIILGFDIGLNDKIKRRLLELGFLKNTQVTLNQKSFLSEVLLLELNGYTISLRSDIAKHIKVDKIKGDRNEK